MSGLSLAPKSGGVVLIAIPEVIGAGDAARLVIAPSAPVAMPQALVPTPRPKQMPLDGSSRFELPLVQPRSQMGK